MGRPFATMERYVVGPQECFSHGRGHPPLRQGLVRRAKCVFLAKRSRHRADRFRWLPFHRVFFEDPALLAR
jgi:hypothetical protein